MAKSQSPAGSTIRSESIEDYIDAFPKSTQGILRRVRGAIHSAVPEAEETISYRMPAFKLRGRILVYFAGFKSHIGLYPPVPEGFRKELARYAGPKGNLRFPLDEPMPLDLIKRIVTYRAKVILRKK